MRTGFDTWVVSEGLGAESALGVQEFQSGCQQCLPPGRVLVVHTCVGLALDTRRRDAAWLQRIWVVFQISHILVLHPATCAAGALLLTVCSEGMVQLLEKASSRVNPECVYRHDILRDSRHATLDTVPCK
jgi:hypothetical protein